MGEVDIVKLNEIYSFCNQFCRLMGLPFSFSEDTGDMETAIAVNEAGHIRKPESAEGWPTDAKVFCPDVLDYHNKIIIEFEETPGKPRHGAHLAKKGHDPDGLDKRTSNRDLYYGIAKFRVHKIFDYEFANPLSWKIKLADFLIKCWKNPVERLAA